MKALGIAACTLQLLVALTPCNAARDGSHDRPFLTWRDASTRGLLFTSDDIVSFDWDKQVFLLKLDATLDFLAWIPAHMHLARELIVEDAQGPICRAHWVSDASSMGFAGPVYRALSPNPFLSIVDGYPPGRGAAGTHQDARLVERLKTGLANAGVLQSIDLGQTYVGLAVQSTGHMWKDVGPDMKIRVEYFKNTFRLGRKARAHVFFAGGEKTRTQIDSLIVTISLVANDGRFRSDIRLDSIPVLETEDGIHVCTFSPWEPVDGSDMEVALGTGEIFLSILLQKQDKTLYRLDFPASRVPIGGSVQAARGSRGYATPGAGSPSPRP